MTIAIVADAQCVFQKCPGEVGYVVAMNNLTGAAYDVTTHTITWTTTLPGSVANGNTLDWASVGSTVGVYDVSYTVTSADGCDSSWVGCVEVISAPAPTYTSQSICTNDLTGIAAAGGLPAGGVYSIGGVPITNILSSMIGQTVDYTVSTTCGTQTTSAVVIGLPVPNPGAVGGP